jgi:hypothetical protein
LPVVPICRNPTSLISTPNHRQIPHHPVPLKRGVCAIVTDVGCGMRWTRAVSATNDVDPRTAKSCGPDAPTLVSSRRNYSPATVARKPGHRGERAISRKTIAQGVPGETGVPVVTTLVCFFYSAREAAGALGTRHSLRPLFARVVRSSTRADRVAGMRSRASSPSPRSYGERVGVRGSIRRLSSWRVPPQPNCCAIRPLPASGAR